MDGLCSGDLASITGGTLKLGILPPLGGEWEPVLRMVTDSRAARRGDVFWDLAASPSAPGALPEEAFARGAVGVVSSRRFLEPWAGAFVVQVSNARQALLDVGRWARQNNHGSVVAVMCTPHSPLPRLLQLLGSTEPESAECHSPFPAGSRTTQPEYVNLLTPPCVTTPIETALCLAHRANSFSPTILPIDSRKTESPREISDLCRPHVAVIYGSSNSKSDATTRLTRCLLGALPADGTAVLVEPSSMELPVGLPGGVELLRIGTTADCEWHVQHVARQGCRTEVQFPRESHCWKLRPGWPVLDVVAAFAVSRLWGVHPTTFSWACETITEMFLGNVPFANNPGAPDQPPTNDTEKSKAPPLVSGLRESDTALPPGLKRFAC